MAKTWVIIEDHPDRLAALLTACNQANPSDVVIPIWPVPKKQKVIVGDLRSVLNRVVRCGAVEEIQTTLNTSTGSGDVIVILDVNLGPIQPQNKFSTSLLMVEWKRLLNDFNRTNAILVYSTTQDRHVYCTALRDLTSDPERVGASQQDIGEVTTGVAVAIVRDAHALWRRAKEAKGLSFEKFIHTTAGVGHITALNSESQDALARFLRLPPQQMESEFQNVRLVKCLKHISGLKSQNGTREVSYPAAWLLALGQFRQCFPTEKWQSYFDSDEFVREIDAIDGDNYPSLFPDQVAASRTETLLKFGALCQVLFNDRLPNPKPVLKKVRLGSCVLSFELNFPLAQTLLNNLASQARHARGDKGQDVVHDTAKALWQFWVSCAARSVPLAEIDNTHGFFPKRTLINLFKNRRLTEVRFGD